MVTRASALGAELRYGCRVDSWRTLPEGVEVATAGGTVRARLLVGADGLRSPVRRAAGLDRPRRGRPRYGIRRHYRVTPWAPFVEVHWQERAEAYVTPAGTGRVGIAFLWDGDGARFDDLLVRFPALAARLRGAIPDSETRGAGPLRRAVVRRHTDRVALVGDAAGYLDALTGEGLTLAFESARALVDVVREGRPLAAYETAYRRLSRTYYLVTGLMLWVAAHPPLRRRVVAALARRPELFDRVLAVNAGAWPLTSLGVGGVVRLVHAVLAEGVTR
jgi:flavin-dependent dehydrogenase